MNRVYLTKEGYEKLRSELEKLEKEERPVVIDAISRAREFGDLSENAEYAAAKERQMHLEKRIAEIHEKLTRSEIIDEAQIPKDKAYLGATVTLKDENKGCEVTYTLVSTDEADFSENKISTESPVGKAMLGKKVGDKVEATVPAGTLNYEILSIDR
ncbi:TPA: transcription elongation factor GreA [Candidatus Latescibacteria bacterium]|nr:transcription elongation factor GreA [Gemmatimonadota bacterium]HAA78403.1 transcription elongation factor GreA [Candidatus Latescibacterota bacterium]|tara:strand:- start:160 stop:630 length:471 start_codon:yes stop_codon:yes gene_type:complete